jgi:hypothetical protein
MTSVRVNIADQVLAEGVLIFSSSLTASVRCQETLELKFFLICNIIKGHSLKTVRLYILVRGYLLDST